MDLHKGDVLRFLIELRDSGERIAIIDHNPLSETGHDLREEGLHVDIYTLDGARHHVELPDWPLPSDDGALIELCADYLEEYHEYYTGVYRGDYDPDDPPPP
jgi:hypothetical protein